MSRTGAIVAALAAGALGSAINVCATQDILNFRDFEPAKEYCAPHYPAQTITSTALPRCLTTTKTNIVATSTVVATKMLSCPAKALSDVDQAEVPLHKRDPEAFGGWGGAWWGNSGGWGSPGQGGGFGGGSGGGYGGPPSWPWWGGQEHSSSGSGSGESSAGKPWWENEPWWQHGGYGEPWWQQGNGGSGEGGQPWWVHPGQGGGEQGGGHHEGGHSGKGKHHRKHFHHAKRCGSSGECGNGEHCYRDQHQWWHDENNHWWYGGQKGGSQGHCVPPKNHQNPHPAPPPCPWHNKPTGNPTHPQTQPHPYPTGNPWHPPPHHPTNPPHYPTNPPHYPTKPPHYPTKPPHSNNPPPYYSYSSSSSSYPESLYPVPTYYHNKRDMPTPVKRGEILETASAWQSVSSSLLQCGYQCIQRACSCIAATTVEYHTPAPTCTETKTKATILHVTTTMEVMPDNCEHNDLRKA